MPWVHGCSPKKTKDKKKRLYPRNIILKLSKVNNKEIILKGKKKMVTYRETPIRLLAN